MKKVQIDSTTPFASSKAQLILTAAAIFAVYYRWPVPFFFLLLYLSYLFWSYAWTLFSSRFTAGESIELQENIFAGETVIWEFRFCNQWFLPLVRAGISFFLPVNFACSSDIPLVFVPVPSSETLAAPGQVIIPWNHCTASYAWLPEKEEVKVAVQVTIPRRGIYYLPPPQLFVGDPSGLFRGLNQVGKEQCLSVFPHIKGSGELLPVLAFEDSERESPIGIEDRYQVQGIRDYQLIDSPKSINWYATTRTGILKSNLYQRKESEYCLVALDVSVAGQPPNETVYNLSEDILLEEAISWAAGIALFHLEQGAKVAFLTNAPLFHWEKKEGFPGGAYMQRTRQVTTLDFASGMEQAQNILKLCASIDGTSRAYPEEHERLWAHIQEAPANSFIYLLACHTPPPRWGKNEEYLETVGNTAAPSRFYSPEKLSSLASSRVKLVDLTRREG